MRVRPLSIALALLPLPVFIVSLCIGSYPIPPATVIQMLLGIPGDWPRVEWAIVFRLRMPRVIMAALGGIALSVSGASLQSTFRNPLVDSYILGVSAGAAFGAALGLGLLSSMAAAQVLAFCMGLLAFTLTYAAARTRGETPVVSLVLAGIIITALFSAALATVKFFVDPHKTAEIVYWLMGSFSCAGWDDVAWCMLPVGTGFVLLYLLRWRMNALSMGDEEAKALGVDVHRLRFLVLVASTLMASAIVSTVGIIGWVGLIVPHSVRMALKTPDNRIVIPLSACVGAAYLMIADDFARAATGYELPVGILTTLSGAPFFLYLLRRKGVRVWS